MTADDEMNAVTIDRFGGPEVLRFGRVARPVAGPGQVLVQVAYAGVGQWDPLEREGLLTEITGEDPDFPLIIGGDGSGIVVAVGAGVHRFSVGDRVFGLGGGFYAEYLAVDVRTLAPVPTGLGLDEAGAMPIVALTAWQGLVEELRLARGETVVIHGASGDAGHLAVQLAGRLGARVFAVASGADGVEVVRALGADAAVDGRTDDVSSRLRDFAPAGVDAVLAFAAGPSLSAIASAVRAGGRLAYPLGVEVPPEQLAGIDVRTFDLTLDGPEVTGRKLLALTQLIADGSFRVALSSTFPPADIVRAHEAVTNHRVGKVVLAVGPQDRANQDRAD